MRETKREKKDIPDLVSSLSEEQRKDIYLSRDLYKFYVSVLENGEKLMFSRRLRQYCVKLLKLVNPYSTELIETLQLPISQNEFIDIETRHKMLRVFKKYEELIVGEGEKEANKFLLKNGHLKPKLVQFFKEYTKDAYYFSYPITKMITPVVEISGSIEEDEFYRRLENYAETSEYENVIKYTKEIPQDEKDLFETATCETILVPAKNLL